VYCFLESTLRNCTVQLTVRVRTTTLLYRLKYSMRIALSEGALCGRALPVQSCLVPKLSRAVQYCMLYGAVPECPLNKKKYPPGRSPATVKSDPYRSLLYSRRSLDTKSSPWKGNKPRVQVGHYSGQEFRNLIRTRPSIPDSHLTRNHHHGRGTSPGPSWALHSGQESRNWILWKGKTSIMLMGYRPPHR
jgi:hypothetical protein